MKVRALALAAAVAVVLTGCTDDADGEAGGSPAPSASLDPAAEAARQLTEQVLGGDEAPEPLTSVTGNLPVLGGGAPVTVEILEVRAGAESTLLRWRLRSADREPVRVYTSALSLPNRFDTRAVALADVAGNQRLAPFTFVPQKSEVDFACVCSELPDAVGLTGALMYALYPPLNEAATEVDVLIPGLPPARGVRVTR